MNTDRRLNQDDSKIPGSINRRSGIDRRQSENRTEVSPELYNDYKETKKDVDDVFKAFRTFDARVKYALPSSYVINSYIQNTDNKVMLEKLLVEGGASACPYTRRAIGCRDSFDENNNTKGLGKLAILLINMPEDTRDTWNAAKQLLHIPEEAGHVKVPNPYQVKYSFFRGTALEPILIRLPDDIKYKFIESDKTLYDTKFGKQIFKVIGENPNKLIMKTSRPDKIYGEFIKAYGLEGKVLTRYAGRAMMRIPVISVYAFSALEVPAIIKAFTCSKDIREDLTKGGKQLIKSGINVSSFTISSAVLGSLLASKMGAVGSLVGIGLGSYYGTKIGNCINAQIDKI